MRQVYIYIVKTRKKLIITSKINIKARRIDDNDALMIISLVSSHPSRRCLACIPHVVASLASRTIVSPPSRCHVFTVMTMALAHEYRRQRIH